MKHRVAVSGVGGGVGQSILKALQLSEYEVVGLDGDSLAAGLYACREARLIPYARDPLFPDEVLRTCLDSGCNILFPGLDTEPMPLSLSRERFATEGITVVVSSPDVIAVSDDKL